MSERRNEYWLEEIMFCPLEAKEASGADMSRGREQPIFRCMEALGLPLVGPHASDGVRPEQKA